LKSVWVFFRPILFSLDAEKAHIATVRAIHALSSQSLGRAFLRQLSKQSRMQRQQVRLFDLTFRSRVGLAAGFDKNGELLQALPHLGFGFAEIGTVTPRPQLGNDKPRLFRIPEQQAIWNSMGFNNEGAEIVARRLSQARMAGWIPSDFPVGVNLGKNKDTPNEEAWRDYRAVAQRFADLADYLVINVSSPNTPGLRSLQSPEAVRRILEAVLDARKAWGRQVPVLLKLAPEISETDLGEIIQTVDALVDGWVLTNTRQALSPPSVGHPRQGGLSGLPLRQISGERLIEVKRLTSKVVVSCGGIMDELEARHRIHSGADLLQVYSGYVFEGPDFPVRLTRGMG